MALLDAVDDDFAFVGADFYTTGGAIQHLASPAFQRVVAVFLHCLPEDGRHQQTGSCKAVILWWTLTTVRC